MSLKLHKNIIRNPNAFEKLLVKTLDLSNLVIQDIDFRKSGINWEELIYNNTTFLGCKFNRDDAFIIIDKGGYVYPKFKNIPYKPYRQSLYTWQELMEGYSEIDDDSMDLHIYNHFIKNKYTPPINEALAQRIHDHSIDDALRQLLGYDENGMTQKKAVGFMGGHGTLRGSEFYIKTALSAKLTAENGYYVVSGGGPGIMEAANLGAYFAHQPNHDLKKAIAILSEAPKYTDQNFTQKAMDVLTLYPDGKGSLAVPTWFYGHEPSNLFASNIAKYFSNSIREDTLLAISLYGVVYAPGSAGTTQEIFQEATQNHYGTFGYYSPMVFLSKKRYVEDTSIYSVLHQLAKGRKYKDFLFLTDDPALVVKFLKDHPPVKV
ncbi:MAG: LOG family protein [Flavobacteriales bacterium]